jgi:AcrR family transcriptional regulator
MCQEGDISERDPALTELTGVERTVDKKRQLLDAAERVYCQHGNLGLTVRRLAAEGDTTSQTIYTYFGSRDAVIVAMYERVVADLERLLRPLGEELRSGSGQDPRTRLIEIAMTYRAYCLEHPAHHKMLSEGIGPEGTDAAAIMRLQAQLIDLVEQAQLAAGIMPRGMNDLGARQAIAPLHGLILAELSGFLERDGTDDRARDLVARLMGLDVKIDGDPSSN